MTTIDRSTPSITDLLSEMAAALADPSRPSSSLMDLHERAALMEAQATLAATDAKRTALEPSSSPAEVANLLREAGASAFDAERIAVARQRLSDVALARLEQDASDRQTEAYNHLAGINRDAVAARLAAEYPDLQARLLDLLSALMASNNEVDSANRERSDGMPVLQRAEGLARGFHDRDNLLSGGGAPYNFEIVRLVQMMLPDFANADRLAWPPASTVDQRHRDRAEVPKYAVVHHRFLKQVGK